jgi:flagellar basal-body rod protein FlgF
MQNVFAIALASMHHDMSRMDRVALNLANVSTPGYRREVVAVRPFAVVLDDARAAQAATAAGVTTADPANAPGAVQVVTDTRPGTLSVTGNPLDVALTGDGFFEVSTPEGPAYTRQGSFAVDARGRLVTSSGHPVMGRNGEIVLTTRTPVIDVEGRITEPDAITGPSAADSGTVIAQLKVVRFEDARSLRRLGQGLVAQGTGMTEVGAGEAQLRQGALENANVSSMHEMVQMIETMRHFESMQRVAQGYDEMLGTAIRKLGDLA